MLQVKLQNKKNVPAWNYPALGWSDVYNIIVLFKSEGLGTILYADESCGLQVGEYYTTWYMDYFLPFDSSVCLKNQCSKCSCSCEKE